MSVSAGIRKYDELVKFSRTYKPKHNCFKKFQNMNVSEGIRKYDKLV